MSASSVSDQWVPPATLAWTSSDSAQSALAALGIESARILALSEVMFVGGAVILVVVGLAVAIALYGSPEWRRTVASERMVVWLGITFPVVTLSALLLYGFFTLRLGQAVATDAGVVKISVTGHQWWWRVVYLHDDGSATESANELRIPVGVQVEIALTTADVLHSFWVPAYAGKVDMVPGRINYLRFTATEAGRVRGQCAEYCGGAHAFMAFHVEAMEPESFARWMAAERADASPTALSDGSVRGLELFIANGCGGCHSVRGTGAVGHIGPDLTHVGSRHGIGAATLPTSEASFEQWLRQHQALKPGNRMPAFDFLTADERRSLARFLLSLK